MQRRQMGGAPGATKRLLKYILNAYTPHLICVLVCVLVSAAAGVIGSSFLQRLIDDYITPLIGAASPSFQPLLRAILVMGAIYLLGVVATYAYNRLMVTVSQGVMKRLRDDMFAHMQTLSVRFFDTNQVGDVMSRYTNDTDALRQMLSQSLPQLLSSLVTIVMVVAAMLVLSPLMTLVVAVTMFLMVRVAGSIAGKSGKYFRDQQMDIGEMNGYIEEMINGQKVVKVFCHEEEAKAGFDRLNQKLCASATRANQFGNVLGPLMNNLGYVQYILVAVAGGALAIAGMGGLSLGMIASFLQLSRSIANPIGQISQQLNSVVMAVAGAGRIFALIDEPQEPDQGYVTLVNAQRGANGELTESEARTGLWAWKHPHGDGTLTYTELRGDVRFFNVDFSYVEGKPVLQDVTLYAKPGQKLALVGATGAGKTTITNLINRFYDIEDGKIRYDGININKIKKADLRRSLGIVLQDTHLFTGTIMENIRYGNPLATDAQVVEAARLANADGFINRLQDGYDTLIEGDGAGLSQGQKQLLSIARAAVADPPVMILDEATSSIDTRTEAIVQRGMDALMQGRTVFVIAHRLSTIQNANAIMVMEHGRIIERGDHDELLAEKGTYYRLYTGATDAA